jgi:pentatricopeptide repeat protein
MIRAPKLKGIAPYLLRRVLAAGTGINTPTGTMLGAAPHRCLSDAIVSDPAPPLPLEGGSVVPVNHNPPSVLPPVTAGGAGHRRAGSSAAFRDGIAGSRALSSTGGAAAAGASGGAAGGASGGTAGEAASDKPRDGAPASSPPLTHDLRLVNLALDAMAQRGDAESARARLAALMAVGFVPDVVTYTTLIKAHGAANDYGGIVTTTEEMTAAGIRPDQICLGSMAKALSVCSSVDPATAVELVINFATSNGVVVNTVIANHLLRLYADISDVAGVMSLLRRFVDLMVEQRATGVE